MTFVIITHILSRVVSTQVGYKPISAILRLFSSGWWCQATCEVRCKMVPAKLKIGPITSFDRPNAEHWPTPRTPCLGVFQEKNVAPKENEYFSQKTYKSGLAVISLYPTLGKLAKNLMRTHARHWRAIRGLHCERCRSSAKGDVAFYERVRSEYLYQSLLL